MKNKHFWSGWFNQSSTPVQEEKVEKKLYDEYILILLNPDGEKIPASLRIDIVMAKCGCIIPTFELMINEYTSNCLLLHNNYKYLFTNRTIVRVSGGMCFIGDDENSMRIIQTVFKVPYPGLLVTEFIGRPYEILECEKVED